MVLEYCFKLVPLTIFILTYMCPNAGEVFDSYPSHRRHDFVFVKTKWTADSLKSKKISPWNRWRF